MQEDRTLVYLEFTTDLFPYMGADDGWKWVIHSAFLFLRVHKELPRAWDKRLC